MDRDSVNYPDGSRYQGDMQGGKRHGQGTWVRPDNTKYVGQWVDDKPHGQGTITWPDGRQYTGQWMYGKRHGRGADIYPDGRRVEGEWEDGEFKREAPAAPGPQEGFPAMGEPRREPPSRFQESGSYGDQGSYRDSEPDLGAQGKGFISSLFDISMKDMVTPKIIRVFYVIGMVLIGLGALGSIVFSLFTIGDVGVVGLIGAIIAAPIGAFLGIVFLRIYMELIILLFNIYDQLRDIKRLLSR